MKQTAVQWFREKVFFKGSYTGEELRQLFEDALEMEKKQITETFVKVSRAHQEALGNKLSLQDIIDYKKIAEVYYNEEYETKENR
jgi:hypothetical protein